MTVHVGSSLDAESISSEHHHTDISGHMTPPLIVRLENLVFLGEKAKWISGHIPLSLPHTSTSQKIGVSSPLDFHIPYCHLVGL